MSSRALRKLQRQREQEQRLQEANGSTSDGEEHPIVDPKPKTNAFGLLETANLDPTSDSGEAEQLSETKDNGNSSASNQNKRGREKERAAAKLDAESDPADLDKPISTRGAFRALDEVGDDRDRSPVSSNRAKKKKNKGKKRAGTNPAAQNGRSQDTGLDQALDSVPARLSDEPSTPGNESAFEAEARGYKELGLLLVPDSKDLNPINEMKRLFGNVVLETERENRANLEANRRRGGAQEVHNLATILAGHNVPAAHGRGQARNLAAVALRRNVFMPGKEHWPAAASGGLGMELIEDLGASGVMYEFVHSKAYQDVQRQFEMCVESMDPQLMISHLVVNPYHVATLLQVSEIAKQQGDHSLSADLLERALFTFGRSAHSTFTANLREGNARLDFVIPENREFWLTVWRYVASLGQRGTWRTAYEWAKLLLSIDPVGDPYGVTLMIDQLALRARNYEHFIKLCASSLFHSSHGHRPNIHISLALAHFRAGHSMESRIQLSLCLSRYPWMFARLFKELGIDPIPRSLWGYQPREEHDILMCELYVTRAKDLWNTPETITLLKEVAIAELPPKATVPGHRNFILRTEARHVLLLEDPALISLLPRLYTERYGSAADPLPPLNRASVDFLTSHDNEDVASSQPRSPALTIEVSGLDGIQQIEGGRTWLLQMIDALRGRQGAREVDEQTSTEYLEQALQSADLGAGDEETESTPVVGRQATVEEDLWESDLDEPFRLPQPPLVEDDAPVLETPEEADQRNQRFLAGRGLQAVRDFVAVNGADEGNWAANIDQTPLTEYASRVVMLRSRASRRFILNYVLQQGTSSMIKDLIVRKVENLAPGSTR